MGTGEAAFKYLAPYIFRVAISNRRILKLEDGRVTFSYKESATDQVKFSTIPAEEFIRRFLQHVLPDHFVKVRYYGLLSPAHRHRIEKARELLSTSLIDNSTPLGHTHSGNPATTRTPAEQPSATNKGGCFL